MTSVLSFSVHDCQKICIWTPLFGHRDIDSPSSTDDRGSCLLYTLVPKRAKPERPQLLSPQSGSPLTLWYLCENGIFTASDPSFLSGGNLLESCYSNRERLAFSSLDRLQRRTGPTETNANEAYFSAPTGLLFLDLGCFFDVLKGCSTSFFLLAGPLYDSSCSHPGR